MSLLLGLVDFQLGRMWRPAIMGHRRPFFFVPPVLKTSFPMDPLKVLVVHRRSSLPRTAQVVSCQVAMPSVCPLDSGMLKARISNAPEVNCPST